MSALALFVRIVNQLNEWIGRTVSWLTLGVVLVCFSVVVLRYAFNIGFVWMQDIYVWLHAIAFTLGAGYALLHDHHVRVDIFYRPASERYKAWLNLLGVLLLLLTAELIDAARALEIGLVNTVVENYAIEIL